MRMNPSRRTLLRDGSLVLFGAGLVASSLATLLADDAKRRVRIGMVTDLHYADKPPAGSRHYRETLAKLEEAAAQFQKDKPDFVVELGDLIDAAASVETEKNISPESTRTLRHCPATSTTSWATTASPR